MLVAIFKFDDPSHLDIPSTVKSFTTQCGLLTITPYRTLNIFHHKRLMICMKQDSNVKE
ncbi:unnamed protein product [Staurois parvus]|uniref:Uncharacterized protein n=1 Tax=Staurois parvus TaxID=386267 RepID=A0ABN9AGS8_9NEOB|nr:unnamed protein product [Staurois parvus]